MRRKAVSVSDFPQEKVCLLYMSSDRVDLAVILIQLSDIKLRVLTPLRKLFLVVKNLF